MKNKIYFLFCLILYSLTLVSANGLQITPNTLSINKTNTINYIQNFTIRNEEPFTFYNVTSNNPLITFNKFTLLSGENKTFQTTITSNNPFNGQIKFIGDYFANLGQQNETENITITSSGVDLCNLDLIQGDTLIWDNTILGEVKLKNLNTNEFFATISSEGFYKEKFIQPIEFDYRVFRIGLPISPTCHINVRPTQGYVHSQEYDAILNLNLKVIFEPTTIQANFLTTSYQLSYNQKAEDIFQIKNTGNKIGKNINCSGEWITFTENNFDLAVGQSKNIGYTIQPLIFTTENTGKTYNKTITCKGNFPTVNKDLEIKIDFKDLDSLIGNISYDPKVLSEFVKLYCIQNPDDCPQVQTTSSSSQDNVTFQVGKEAYIEQILSEAQFQEDVRTFFKNFNERLSKVENNTDEVKKNNNQSTEKTQGLSNQLEDYLNNQNFIFSTLGFIAIIILVLFILKSDRVRIKLGKTLHKGEKLP